MYICIISITILVAFNNNNNYVCMYVFAYFSLIGCGLHYRRRNRSSAPIYVVDSRLRSNVHLV